MVWTSYTCDRHKENDFDLVISENFWRIFKDFWECLMPLQPPNSIRGQILPLIWNQWSQSLIHLHIANMVWTLRQPLRPLQPPNRPRGQTWTRLEISDPYYLLYHVCFGCLGHVWKCHCRWRMKDETDHYYTCVATGNNEDFWRKIWDILCTIQEWWFFIYTGVSKILGSKVHSVPVLFWNFHHRGERGRSGRECKFYK